MTHITSHRRSGKPWRSIMAAIATAAMALSPGAAAYAADADATAPATTASANLRGAWNFENTAAGDREAANNGGSSSATAQLIGDDISIIADPAGVFGNVLHFGAGASSYMKINQYVNTGAGNASFAMWYRYDTTLDPTGDKPAVLLQQDGAGRSLLTLRPSNQYHTYVNATDVLSNNTVARGGWQHIAVSFDQTSRKVKFYVNGALDSEKNMGTSAVNAVTALLVGSHKNIGTMDPHSMKGDVDDIRVYDATLTDDQAAAIYAEQGTALARKQLGTLVSQADALLAAGEVDAASAQAQALATAKRNAVNAMDNTSGSAAARMTAMNAAGTALQTAITAYQAHVPITLTADPSTVERTVDSASIFGVNHRYAFNGYGSFDPDTMRVKDDFTALYKQVGFGSIRYPGGTISNLFNWKTTIGPRAQRLKQVHGFYNNPGQGGIEPNFGIGDFLHLYIVVLAVSGYTKVYIDLGAEHGTYALRIDTFVIFICTDCHLTGGYQRKQFLCCHAFLLSYDLKLRCDDAFTGCLHLCTVISHVKKISFHKFFVFIQQKTGCCNAYASRQPALNLTYLMKIFCTSDFFCTL